MVKRMTKNRLKTFAVLILLATTITYVSLLYLNIEAYNNYRQEKLNSYPESVRPYVDFEPFIYTAIGQTFL
jgi:cell division protein FtsI/penicillin-binding protein 2